MTKYRCVDDGWSYDREIDLPEDVIAILSLCNYRIGVGSGLHDHAVWCVVIDNETNQPVYDAPVVCQGRPREEKDQILIDRMIDWVRAGCPKRDSS